MKKSYLLPAVIVVGCFMSASHASAALITYTDRAAWLAAITGSSTIDFEGIAAPTTSFATPGGITISSVNFLDYNLSNPAVVPNYLYVVDSKFHPNTVPPNPPGTPLYPYDRGTGASMQGPSQDNRLNAGTVGNGILVTLPGAGNTAVGSDFWAFFFEKTLVPTATFQVTYFNGATNLGSRNFNTLSYPGVQFFGVTSDTPVTKLFVISLPGSVNTPDIFFPYSFVEMDNFSSGTASASPVGTATPEPSTFVLLSGALAGLWIRRRRA